MERLKVTEANDLTKRIAQLRARLTPEGNRFLDEYEHRIETSDTDLGSMSFQAWVAEQLPTLSEADRDIAMRVLQLNVLKTFGGSSGEEIVEEMVERAKEGPQRPHNLIAGAQQMQVYASEPLQPDMNLQEEGDVLRRLLLDPGI